MSMPRFAHGYMLAALVSFSLACPSKPEPAAESKPTEVAPERPVAATPEPEPESPPETPPSPLAEHMRDHFGKAAQLELEVVDGALDNARARSAPEVIANGLRALYGPKLPSRG